MSCWVCISLNLAEIVCNNLLPFCIRETLPYDLKKGRTGGFAKTVFYFLRADEKGSCIAIVKGKAVNLGDGEGMQVPCTLHFKGTTKFIDVLRQQFQKNN